MLGPDEVLVLDDADGHVAVASCRSELTPAGRHPLALALARRFTVISLADLPACSTEIAVYEGGAVRELSLVGPEAAEHHAPPAAPLALERFRADGPRALELRAALTHAGVFANFLGLECRGYRARFEAAPLSDVGERFLWVFAAAGG